MTDAVLSELHNGVLLATLNRPGKMNALSPDLWDRLIGILQKATENPDVRVVVITGAGENFCSGADLDTLQLEIQHADDRRFLEAGWEQLALSLAQFEKPLITAIQGFAVGGGATMSLHSDITYVGESVKWQLPFMSLGGVPEFGATYLLPQMVGKQRAAEMIFTAKYYGPDELVKCGIALQVFPDERLLEETMKIAEQIAQWPLSSLVKTKRLLNASDADAIFSALEKEHVPFYEQIGSPDNLEAIAAFREKRKPVFNK